MHGSVNQSDSEISASVVAKLKGRVLFPEKIEETKKFSVNLNPVHFSREGALFQLIHLIYIGTQRHVYMHGLYFFLYTTHNCY